MIAGTRVADIVTVSMLILSIEDAPVKGEIGNTSKLARRYSLSARSLGKSGGFSYLLSYNLENGKDNLDVNDELVRQGYAWVCRGYAKDKDLYRLEMEAQEARKGLWASDKPTPPVEVA